MGVIEDVCAQYHITREQLRSRDRSPHLKVARAVCAQKLRDKGLSVLVIGRLLNRNHSTIIYYIGPSATIPKTHVHRPDIKTETLQELRDQGLSYFKIGQLVGLTHGGVRSRLAKAHKKDPKKPLD